MSYRSERGMEMKKTIGILLLVFVTVFMSVGYAQITDFLQVSGKADVSIPYGLFITEVKKTGESNVDHHTISFMQYSTTVDLTLDKKDDTTSGGWWGQTTKYAGSVTYEIKVYNNTEYEYAYRDLYYQKSDYNNSSVVKSANDDKLSVVTSFPNGSVVAPGEHLVFYVTYTVGKNMNYSTDWRTLLNYQFGINVDSIDKAADIVYSKFLNILNTTSTYLQLIEVLDDKFDGEQTWTSNYVGNVGNAIDNDMMTVETLFAGQLVMMVNGQQQQARVIIKHENIDDNELTTGDDYSLNYSWGPYTHTGCEMTLYMTIDPLTTANGWAPVYAAVFTCDRDPNNGNKLSEWYKIGDTYYGQANIVGYKGEYGATGSFVTDNWISYAGTYKVTDRYSYQVTADNKLVDVMKVVDQAAITEFQRLLVEAEAMIANQKYAGTGITVVEDAYAKAATFYTKDASGKAIANAGTRRVALVPIMNELDYVLSVAQDAIDKIEQGIQP